MHYTLLSVHPSCANHNSIMEHSTKLKLLGEVALTSSNWQNNFVVKSQGYWEPKFENRFWRISLQKMH